jgi:hypothetical protein
MTDRHKPNGTEGKGDMVTSQPPTTDTPAPPSLPPTSTPQDTSTPVYVQRIYTSDSEDHYKHLLEYFKNIVQITATVLGFVAVLVGAISGVGLWFNYRSINDVKDEMKKGLADVRTDAKSAIDSTKDGAKLSIDTATSGAQSAIDTAKESAASQISQVRQQAAGIALNEAQRRVDDAFRTTNVQGLVEDAARRQVGPVIDRQVRSEVDRVMGSLQEDISSLGEIADAGSYMRGGGRPGFEKLRALEKSPNERVSERAKAILEAITEDYERVRLNELKEAGFNSPEEMYRANQNANDKAKMIAELVKTIRTDSNLYLVSEAFMSLRGITGYPFRMFDMDAVENWCVQHKEMCK